MALANVNVRFGVDLKQFSTAMQNASRKMDRFGKKMKRTGQSMTMNLTAPIAGLAAVSVMAFDKQAKAIAQVEAGLKSTGNAVGFTSEQLQKMAGDLQKTTLFGDEEILQGATAQLLTFTNIAGAQFAQTQKVALDLATRLDGDLKSASIMLGKALNDPVANLSALSRAGIQFSEEQKSMVKSLVQTNRLADAQSLILAELTKQYGGSAEAAAAAGAGPFKQMSNAIGDLLEQFGEIIAKALTPTVKWIQRMSERFQGLSDGTKKFIVILAGLAAAIGPVLIAIGLMTTGLAAMSTASLPLTATILAVVAVLAALAAGAAYVYENAEAFRDRFLIVWAKIKNAVVDAVINILKAHDKLFSVLGMDMFGRAAKGLERFKSEIPDESDSKPFKSFGETMSNVADEVFGTFEKVKKQAEETTKSVDKAVRKTGDSLQRSVEPIKNLANRGFKNVMGELKTPKFYGPTPEQMKSTETMLDLYDREQVMINNLQTAVAGLGGAFEQMFTTLIDGGENAFGAVVRYLKQLVIRLIAAATAAAILSALLGGLGSAFTFKALFSQFSGFDITGKRAMGGPVIGNLPYLVGERGPELFVPGTSGSIVSNNRMKSLGSENMVVSGEFILSDTTLMAAVERGSQRVLRTNPGLKF